MHIVTPWIQPHKLQLILLGKRFYVFGYLKRCAFISLAQMHAVIISGKWDHGYNFFLLKHDSSGYEIYFRDAAAARCQCPPFKRKAAASSVKTSNLGMNDERSGAKATHETANHIYEAYPL